MSIYTLKDVSKPGMKPDFALELKCYCPFQYKTIGVKRNYEAAQAQVKLDELVKVPLDRGISTQCIAEIDGIQYEIKQVQHFLDTLPGTTQLSLTRLEACYGCL